MIENGFKPMKKWLLMGCVIFTPFFQANALSEDANTKFNLNTVETPSADVGCAVNNNLVNSAFESVLTVELINQTVFFHDYSFALLESFPVEFVGNNYNLLNQNIAKITSTLSQINPTFALQFSVLLTNYLTAGENYVLILNATSNQNDPGVIAAFQTWIANANLIAAFLKQSNSNVNLQSAQTILVSYTNSLAATALNLIPTPSINPNFVAASALYTEARSIASDELTLLIIQAITPQEEHLSSKHHHHHHH
ncbi:MAG: hypothetical protein Q8K60_01435 [Parachlamydiaceae bacterium]|nr:hypothetical protein [Parachlamydiaceae bacterium]